jgi:hypothetical protein
MKENIERKIEIHFTGECQQESFSRFSSDNVTSHLSTQKKKNIAHGAQYEKINKKGKIDNFHVFYRTKKTKTKKKNYTCMKKSEEKQKKNQSFHFPFFTVQKKKFHQLWANPVEIENFFQPYRTILLCLPSR